MNHVICTENEFINNGKKIICFGAAEMAKDAAKNPDILKKIIFFVDNDPEKQNKYFLVEERNFPIKTPESLLDVDWQTHSILITSSHFKAILRQLDAIPELDAAECYVYPIIRQNFPHGGDDFYTQRIETLCVNEYETVLRVQGIKPEKIAELLTEKQKYISGKNGIRPFVIPRVMIMPTTRCNMKCRDCSSLLPYFEKPEDLDINIIKRDLNIFFSAVDQCIRMTVGGEPFLYPKLNELLEYLISQEKLLGILLITNSTIMPKQEILDILRHPNIFVQISDYGHLDKMGKLVMAFEENNVRFSVLTNQIWIDMGGTDNRGRSCEELRYTYLNCEQGRLVKSIHNGRFHICGRSARMLALGRYTSDKDYFCLNEDDSWEIVREKLHKIFYSETADACNYCDCGSSPSKRIPAGIQLSGTFRKSGHTIISREEYNRILMAAELKKSEE